MFGSKEKITSFSRLTLTLKGMRAIDEYEIICKGDVCEIAQYTKYYTRPEDERELNKSVTVDTASIIGLMNDCRMMSWDGFHGPNPRNVRDGYMFTLTAEVNGDKMIRAEGSNNYPRHYSEFRSAINKMLYK